jgi:hypothetical protein
MAMKIENKFPPSNYIDVFPALLTTHITPVGRVLLGASNVHFLFFTFFSLLCILLGSQMVNASGIIGCSCCDNTAIDFYCRKCSVLLEESVR